MNLIAVTAEAVPSAYSWNPAVMFLIFLGVQLSFWIGVVSAGRKIFTKPNDQTYGWEILVGVMALVVLVPGNVAMIVCLVQMILKTL